MVDGILIGNIKENAQDVLEFWRLELMVLKACAFLAWFFGGSLSRLAGHQTKQSQSFNTLPAESYQYQIQGFCSNSDAR